MNTTVELRAKQQVRSSVSSELRIARKEAPVTRSAWSIDGWTDNRTMNVRSSIRFKIGKIDYSILVLCIANLEAANFMRRSTS